MQPFDLWQTLGSPQIAELTALVSLTLPLLLQLRKPQEPTSKKAQKRTKDASSVTSSVPAISKKIQQIITTLIIPWQHLKKSQVDILFFR